MTTDWTPQDWKSKPIVQDVVYEDPAHVERVLNKLNRLPPMVSAAEVINARLAIISPLTNLRQVDNLRNQLKEAALGKSFLLQGGDCAELFDYCSQVKLNTLQDKRHSDMGL
jgi:3-deoxy-7-phosphoheptulonate synthase